MSYRNDTATKTELVIFLRPMVMRDASLDGDLAAYRRYLPGAQFFHGHRARPSRRTSSRALRDIESGKWPGRGTQPVPVVPRARRRRSAAP